MQLRLRYTIYALNTSSSSSRLSNKISSFDLLSSRIRLGYDIGDKNGQPVSDIKTRQSTSVANQKWAVGIT